MPCWGQFYNETDKSNITHVTKFPYLKEFTGLEVRTLIDGSTFI